MALDRLLSNAVLIVNVRLFRVILMEDALSYNELCSNDWSLRRCAVSLYSRSYYPPDDREGGVEDNFSDEHIASDYWDWDNEISDAKVEIVDGRNAVVSYDRHIIFGQIVKIITVKMRKKKWGWRLQCFGRHRSEVMEDEDRCVFIFRESFCCCHYHRCQFHFQS